MLIGQTRTIANRNGIVSLATLSRLVTDGHGEISLRSGTRITAKMDLVAIDLP